MCLLQRHLAKPGVLGVVVNGRRFSVIDGYDGGQHQRARGCDRWLQQRATEPGTMDCPGLLPDAGHGHGWVFVVDPMGKQSLCVTNQG